MNFMRDDEFLLLMSFNETEIINKCHVFTTAERVKLRKAGIKTTIEYPRWYAIEPSKGNYDFSSIETMLQRNREADLKTIFLVYGSSLPQWMPDDWFIKRDTGEVRKEVLSMWNEEAMEHADKYYNTLFAEFAAPDVMFIFGEYMEGEAILPCEPCFFDRAALEDYKKVFGSSAMPNINNDDTREWLVKTVLYYNHRRQFSMLKQHNEIWNMQQWLLNQWSPNTINYAQPRILGSYRNSFPDASIVLLQYTYFDEFHPKENEDYVDMLKDEYNLEVIVEAHYCNGLAETTPKAIKKGFRGQIIGPTHPQAGHDILQDWMIEAIRHSHNLWMKYKNDL